MSDKNIILLVLLMVLILAYIHTQITCTREGFLRSRLRSFRKSRENFFGALSHRFTRVKRKLKTFY